MAVDRREWMSQVALLAAAGLLPAPRRAHAAGTTASAGSGGARSIRLLSNENPYGPSPRARKALAEAIGVGNRYGNGTALIAHIAAREGVTPEHVVLTAGSGELLCTAAAAHCLGGGELIIADPTFDIIATYAESVGGRVVHVPLDEGFRHDLAAMERRVGPSTKLVYLCNPNNPTGTVLPPAAIRRFCDAVSPRATVLVDEAYLEFASDDPARDSAVDRVRAGAAVIVARTFSKIHGLAGLRVGYGLARRDIANKLRGLRMSLPLNSLSIAAADASLGDAAFLADSRRRNSEARDFTVAALKGLGIRPVPSVTNFVWLEVGPQRRELPIKLGARGFELQRTPQPLRGDWMRVSIGTLDEMRRFAEAMRALV